MRVAVAAVAALCGRSFAPGYQEAQRLRRLNQLVAELVEDWRDAAKRLGITEDSKDIIDHFPSFQQIGAGSSKEAIMFDRVRQERGRRRLGNDMVICQESALHELTVGYYRACRNAQVQKWLKSDKPLMGRFPDIENAHMKLIFGRFGYTPCRYGAGLCPSNVVVFRGSGGRFAKKIGGMGAAKDTYEIFIEPSDAHPEGLVFAGPKTKRVFERLEALCRRGAQNAGTNDQESDISPRLRERRGSLSQVIYIAPPDAATFSSIFD